MKKAIRTVSALLLSAMVLTACNSAGTAASSSTAASGSASSAPASAPAASGEKIVMKIAHAAKSGSARDLGAQKIKEIVEAETGGRVEVQLYPNSQLGGGPDLIQGMQSNTIEMVILPSSFMGSFQPLTTIMDIPYLFPDDYEKLIAIESGPAGQALMATTEEIGVKTLGIWHTGYKTFTANSPLDTPAQFAGLKFRVMPSQIQIAQYETLKATPVNMDFSECYNALQTGAIDGQENPLDTTTDMNFQEVQKYCTVSRHGVLDQFIMVSKTWYDGLEPDIQQAILKGVEEGRKVALDKTHEAEAKAMDKMAAANVTVKELSEAEIAAWREALAPVKEIYVNKYGDKAKELLALFESELTKLG